MKYKRRMKKGAGQNRIEKPAVSGFLTNTVATAQHKGKAGVPKPSSDEVEFAKTEVDSIHL